MFHKDMHRQTEIIDDLAVDVAGTALIWSAIALRRPWGRC
jgi:hypothetical protein